MGHDDLLGTKVSQDSGRLLEVLLTSQDFRLHPIGFQDIHKFQDLCFSRPIGMDELPIPINPDETLHIQGNRGFFLSQSLDDFKGHFASDGCPDMEDSCLDRGDLSQGESTGITLYGDAPLVRVRSRVH